jgi:hypothetical protein
MVETNAASSSARLGRESTTIYHRQRKSPCRRQLDAGAGERNQTLAVDRHPIARRVEQRTRFRGQKVHRFRSKRKAALDGLGHAFAVAVA